jgi:hypothetical protein
MSALAPFETCRLRRAMSEFEGKLSSSQFDPYRKPGLFKNAPCHVADRCGSLSAWIMTPGDLKRLNH